MWRALDSMEVYSVVVIDGKEFIKGADGTWELLGTPKATTPTTTALEGGHHVQRRGRGRPRKLRKREAFLAAAEACEQA